jgi:uncharacterized protein
MLRFRRVPRGAAIVGGAVIASALLAVTHPLLASDEKQEQAVVTLSSQVKRVVVTRVPHQADLLEGLRQAVEKEGLKNAAIVSGAGSLTSYNLHTVSNTTFPPENVFTKGEGPWDLLTVTGYVIDGRVHAHVTIVNDQKAFGGHLEPGTRVFTFAIITFAELEEGVSLLRFDDWKWDGCLEAR